MFPCPSCSCSIMCRLLVDTAAASPRCSPPTMTTPPHAEHKLRAHATVEREIRVAPPPRPPHAPNESRRTLERGPAGGAARRQLHPPPATSCKPLQSFSNDGGVGQCVGGASGAVKHGRSGARTEASGWGRRRCVDLGRALLCGVQEILDCFRVDEEGHEKDKAGSAFKSETRVENQRH